MKYVCLFVALIFFFEIFFGRNIKKCKPKLPSFPYKLFYTDEKNFKSDDVICSKLLVSEKHNLCGKPDFVYKNIFTGKLIPVELKSAKLGKKKFPRQGDLMQLATYFIILADEFEINPRCGFLIYDDSAFRIKNNSKLRRQVLSSVQNMRQMLKTGSHPHKKNYAVCRNCLCSCVCER